ncbi:hypothetical protein Q0N12_18125 [Rossellomorea marisflavi]|uniref:hypothetical protein n=1 Tax=Rossellomorea marisflavi TaxID=189381 RepID=UPI00345A6274
MPKEYLLVFEEYELIKRKADWKNKHLLLFEGKHYKEGIVAICRPPGFPHPLKGILYSNFAMGTTGCTLFALPIREGSSLPFKCVDIDTNTIVMCKLVLEKNQHMTRLNILPSHPHEAPLDDDTKSDILSFFSLKTDARTVTFLWNPNVYKRGRSVGE